METQNPITNGHARLVLNYCNNNGVCSSFIRKWHLAITVGKRRPYLKWDGKKLRVNDGKSNNVLISVHLANKQYCLWAWWYRHTSNYIRIIWAMTRMTNAPLTENNNLNTFVHITWWWFILRTNFRFTKGYNKRLGHCTWTFSMYYS